MYLSHMMKHSSQKLLYEDAARWRNQLEALNSFERKQSKLTQDFVDRDIINISYKDNFIVRQYSPQITIGGGEAIDNEVFGKWKLVRKYIDELSKKNERDIIEIIISHRMFNPLQINDAKRLFGMDES